MNLNNFNRYSNMQENAQAFGQAYSNQYAPAGTTDDPIVLSETFAVLMRKVYVWMTLALAVTGLTAFAVANSPTMLNMIL